MSEQEFQSKVIDSLARLETNMKLLVGDDGNQGKVKHMEEDIATLNHYRDYAGGVMATLGFIWTGLVVLVEYLLHRK